MLWKKRNIKEVLAEKFSPIPLGKNKVGYEANASNGGEIKVYEYVTENNNGDYFITIDGRWIGDFQESEGNKLETILKNH